MGKAPRSQSDESGLESTKSDNTESASPVVLIVEDDRSLADLYTTYLEDSYAVRTAYTGAQALELLDQDVDVALLDRRLDEWDGDELLTVIQDRDIDCQVAMVTAVEPDFDIVDLPIDDYLTKTVAREDLRHTVWELLLWTQSSINIQELLRLISRRIALEHSKAGRKLDTNSAFSKLQKRIEVAQQRLDINPEDIQNKQEKSRPAECSECELNWNLTIDGTSGFLQLASGVWKCTECGHTSGSSGSRDQRVARR